MSLMWLSLPFTAAICMLVMHVLVRRPPPGAALRPRSSPQRAQGARPALARGGNGRVAVPLRATTSRAVLENQSQWHVEHALTRQSHWHVEHALTRQPHSDFEDALTRQQLVLHYQPEVTLADHHIVGLEALLRWQHPSKGLLPPGSFVAAVEQTDLIVPLGRWVLEEACASLARLQRMRPDLGMSINVSPRQLEQDAGWVDAVDRTLTASGLAPAALTLEITETALLRETPACWTSLHVLREIGVGIAIDDFGTGYSSLAYLDVIPATLIKLDRRFVEHLQRSVRQRDIVVWIRQLAAQLGIAATAEGIETDQQARLLQALGYTRGQGFHFFRPAPEDAIIGSLLHGQPGSARTGEPPRPPHVAAVPVPRRPASLGPAQPPSAGLNAHTANGRGYAVSPRP